MTTQTEALKLALEALETYKNFIDDAHILEGQWHWIDGLDNVQAAIKEALAQPEQKPVSWKLVPVQPTEEMLKAMDECSTEGYDERLYAGHAASVYMAAVDVAPALPQQCYCGDITRLGVVHRADSFCDEKPEQEPVAWLQIGVGPLRDGDVIARTTKPKEWNPEWWKFEPLYTTPPQRKPLTKEKRLEIADLSLTQFDWSKDYTKAIDFVIEQCEAAHGIKEKNNA